MKITGKSVSLTLSISVWLVGHFMDLGIEKIAEAIESVFRAWRQTVLTLKEVQSA